MLAVIDECQDRAEGGRELRFDPGVDGNDVRSHDVCQAACFDFVESRYFRWGILGIILINMGFLASYSYDQSRTWSHVLNGVDAAFTIVYVLEVLLKWQAAGNLWCAPQ